MIVKYYTNEKIYTFTDSVIQQGSLKDNRANALIAENLSIDTLKFTLKQRSSDPLRDRTGDRLYDSTGVLLYSSDAFIAETFTAYTKYLDYAEVYTNDNVLLSKYYIESVVASGDNSGAIDFSFVSLMGVLDTMKTHGGMYSSYAVGSLIEELMGDYTYSIDGDLSASTFSGWIPAGSRRQALQHVLFQAGASVLKDANGDIEFTFNLPQTATIINLAGIGGRYEDNSEAASEVRLTEHTFASSIAVDDEIIYEGETYADHVEIIFEKPFNTLVADGLTIHESGANYAVISGIGTLTGKPYVHMQRILSKATDAKAVDNVIEVTDAYLISPLNSLVCLERLAAYYGQTKEVNIDLILSNQNPGAMLCVPDPIDYSKTITGYVKSMQRTFSRIIKANTKLTSGWTPGHIGNAYDSYVIIDSSSVVNGVFSPPADAVGKRGLLVIFGGAQGGQGGNCGESQGPIRGKNTDTEMPFQYNYVGDFEKSQQGGKGGKGGKGGNIGKMVTVNLASIQSQYSVSLGEGGDGGDGGTVTRNTREWTYPLTIVDPTEGSYGTHTTFGQYDTDDGVYLQGADVINIVTGEVLARGTGESGLDGGNGGAGHDSAYYVTKDTSSYDPAEEYRGARGDNVESYTGGEGGAGLYDVRRQEPSSSLYYYFPVAGGGGGGGAAFGGNGQDGTDSDMHIYESRYDAYHMSGSVDVDTWVTPPIYYYNGARGGDGADATGIPADAAARSGGTGGGGGGGGGGAGAPHGWVKAGTEGDTTTYYGASIGGKGGNGGKGGKGGPGWGILYYKAGDE